ncbi:DUF6447 family protein [uncultured Lentibacter sp.]|uniref:DUF6447 family protein n=1 Tax=uncultured Lentibacter sp. TaxID=1659309 RepID=UPI00260944CF|nr:DUF6447 family protein [uncultured Lentibacter sp.]
MATQSDQVITVDGKDYKLAEMSDAAKAQIANVQFVDEQIQQRQNEWAVADTARLGYTAALKGELLKAGRK